MSSTDAREIEGKPISTHWRTLLEIKFGVRVVPHKVMARNLRKGSCTAVTQPL